MKHDVSSFSDAAARKLKNCMLVCAPRLYLATSGRGVRCVCVCVNSGFGCASQLFARVLGRVCVCGALRLYPATPGWGVRRGCVCLGSGFGCAPPLLAGVLGCVCARVRATLVPRHFWLGCAVWVCVLRLGFRLLAASPGWGVGVCAFMCLLRLRPATPGWGVRGRCVCLGSSFGCTPAGVLGCVCVHVRALLVPRHSWLWCAVWVGVLGLRLRLRPATPGWGVGMCVCALRLYPATPGWDVLCGRVCLGSRFGCAPPLLAGVLGCVCTVCALRLYPATPGWGVRCGCVCVGSSFGCTPPLLAGVLGCVCVCVRAPLVPRHSWLGCGVWICVLGLGLWLRPATPGWGVGLCVCLFAHSACTPPLVSSVCGVLVWCSLAPVPVPRFVACYARCPELRHPVAVVAWQLSVCLVCGRRRASLACLVAPRGVPRLVWSGRSRSSGRLSRRRGAFSHPGGLRPQLYWVAARGRRRSAENRAHCACRWPPPRQGSWAHYASYSSGALRTCCPWWVPPASVLGCVRCGGSRVWTRSLTRPVSRTIRLPTGDSVGAQGLFRVDVDTAYFGTDY